MTIQEIEELTHQEIEQRMADIHADIETRGDQVTDAELTAYETEVKALEARKAKLIADNTRRSGLLSRVAGGETGAQVVRSFGRRQAEPAPEEQDRFDTPEYRKAFMEYVCRGVPIPAEMRADATTTTTDASAAIPTTYMNEIIKKVESYGELYAMARKTNIQGGVRVPILTLKPEAQWIGETASESQKLSSDAYVQFDYKGLEVKIAQTLLASVTTLVAFQAQFVPLAAEAMVKALEIAMFNGNGTTQMLGVLKDTRVPEANVITLAAADFTTWAGWKKKVFAKMKKAYRTGDFIMAQGTFDGYIDGMVDTNNQPIGRVNYGIDGEEKYRFGGKTVRTVEDDVIKAYDDAATGDVVAVFMKAGDYCVNSNLQMRTVKWEDHDTNELKNKCTMVADGKMLDVNGVLIIKKGA